MTAEPNGSRDFALFAREAEAELQTLVGRLQNVRAQLHDAVDGAVRAELEAAIVEARELATRIGGGAEAGTGALNAQREHVVERTRQLAATSRELESVMRDLPYGVVVLSAASELLLANRRAEELLGSRAEMSEIFTQRPWPLFHPDGRPVDELERPVASALRRKEPARQRLIVERPDGERVLFDISTSPIVDDEGQPRSLVLTFDDVTERDRRERAERDFITNAAHELQTPLAGIVSAIEVLQAGAKDRPADRERFLAHIHAATERLVRLTRALLVLARAQTRDEAPRREVIALEPLLRTIASSLRTDGVEIECDSGVAVIANRLLLEQALANLGENAIKHAGGAVRFHAERRNGRVAIDVVDHGPGIASVEQDVVMERFYRSAAAGADGFGLGLAIVREAVDALDGELELESGPTGTRVSILLPSATITSR